MIGYFGFNVTFSLVGEMFLEELRIYCITESQLVYKHHQKFQNACIKLCGVQVVRRLREMLYTRHLVIHIAGTAWR